MEPHKNLFLNYPRVQIYENKYLSYTAATTLVRNISWCILFGTWGSLNGKLPFIGLPLKISNLVSGILVIGTHLRDPINSGLTP